MNKVLAVSGVFFLLVNSAGADIRVFRPAQEPVQVSSETGIRNPFLGLDPGSLLPVDQVLSFQRDDS